LRGGIGVYYDLGSGEAAQGFTGFPFSSDTVAVNVPFPIPPAQAQPPAFPPVTLPLTGIPVYSLNQDLKLPYTLEWNVGVQQSLGANQTVSVSYVAAIARRLLTTQSLNNKPTGLPRPNLNFGKILYTSNGPTSDYHSLQAQFQRRLSRGLQALVNYTWSHAIDEVSDEVTQGTLARGNADFDIRHNLTAAMTYDLPKMRGRLMSSLVGGWSVDSTFYAQTGRPVNLTAGTIYMSDGVFVQVRPDVVPATPFWIVDPTAPGGQRINPAAFALPPVNSLGIFARQGTLGRNVVRQPGFSQVNFGVRRQFRISEKLRLQLKAEAFNVLNHPAFDGYTKRPLGFPDAGKATTTLNKSLGGLNSLYQIGGARSMQFSAKLSF
jgi:hypothetical protein